MMEENEFLKQILDLLMETNEILIVSDINSALKRVNEAILLIQKKVMHPEKEEEKSEIS